MPSSALQPQLVSGFHRSTADEGGLRDILWNRPVFRAPTLPNPRVVFDPPPFRTQLFTAARRVYRLARR